MEGFVNYVQNINAYFYGDGRNSQIINELFKKLLAGRDKI